MAGKHSPEIGDCRHLKQLVLKTLGLFSTVGYVILRSVNHFSSPLLYWSWGGYHVHKTVNYSHLPAYPLSSNHLPKTLVSLTDPFQILRLNQGLHLKLSVIRVTLWENFLWLSCQACSGLATICRVSTELRLIVTYLAMNSSTNQPFSGISSNECRF